MTIYCVKCIKEAIPGDRSRSFHKFPDDLALKEKWMKSTGISKVTKYTKLCSDHFTQNAFVDSDGYTSTRRLRPGAIPCISVEQIECVKYSFTANETQTNGQNQQCASMVDVNVAVDSLCSTSNELSVNSIGVVNTDRTEYSKSPSFQVIDSSASMASDTSTIISKSCVQIPNLSTDLLPEEVIEQTPCEKFDSSVYVESDTSTLLSESYANILRRSGSTELSHDQFIEPTALGKTKSNVNHTNLKRSLPLCDITDVSPNKKLCSSNVTKSSVLQISSRGSQSNVLCGSMKRHISTIDISHIPTNKKFRFYDGSQPMHLSREDFATDESWFRFLKYTIYKNRQKESSRKKNERKAKKIGNIKELVSKLREENATAAADYLQPSLEPSVPDVSFLLNPSTTNSYRSWRDSIANNKCENNHVSVTKKQVGFDNSNVPVKTNGQIQTDMHCHVPWNSVNNYSVLSECPTPPLNKIFKQFQEVYMANIPNRNLDLSLIDIVTPVSKNCDSVYTQYNSSEPVSLEEPKKLMKQKVPTTCKEYLERGMINQKNLILIIRQKTLQIFLITHPQKIAQKMNI